METTFFDDLEETLAPVQNYKIYFAHMVSHMHMLVVPALFPFLPKFFDASFVDLGIGMSLYMVVTLIFQVPFGYAVDRYGPKKMLGAGMALSGLAFISLGIFPNYIWFLVVMGIVGLVNTIYHPADYSLLSAQTAPEKLGRAFAFHTFSGNLGFAITPGIMFLSVTLGGVPLAFIVAGLLPIIGVYLLEPLPETIRAGKYFLFESWKPALEHITGDTGEIPVVGEKKQSDLRTHFSAQIIVLTLFFTMTMLSSLPFQQFGATVFEFEYGFSSAEAAAMITVYLFANAFGILVGGVLADYSKHHGLIASLSFVLAFLLTIWVILGSKELNLWALIVLLAVIGAAVGAISPSRDLMVKKLAPAGSEGKVFAIVSTGFHIAGAVGPIYLTWFLDHGEMRWVFIAAAVATGISIVIAVYQEVLIIKKHRVEADSLSR